MDDGEKRDWSEWHRSYDDPTSRLAGRLRVVQKHLRQAIDDRHGPVRIVSMCAGEGRDVVGVLKDHPRRAEVVARLVELDPRNAAAASSAADAAGLDQVEVICADAAVTDTYDGAVPADIVLACGIFGNISEDDIVRTIEYLPCLCAPNATVIWTRGYRPERDVASEIRRWFDDRGFEEVAFEAPAGATFRVGVHRLTAKPRDLARGVRLFRFLR